MAALISQPTILPPKDFFAFSWATALSLTLSMTFSTVLIVGLPDRSWPASPPLIANQQDEKMRYCKSFLDYMSEFLLQGASNTWEGKGQVSLPGAAVGVCRVVCVRTRGGCSYMVEVTRSIVGAPPRCEAKSNQYTEPVRSHPGRGLLQGGGDAFSCRSTASVRSEGKPIHRACLIRTRGGCSYRCCAEMKKPPHLSMRGLLIWRSGRDSNPRPPA